MNVQNSRQETVGEEQVQIPPVLAEESTQRKVLLKKR